MRPTWSLFKITTSVLLLIKDTLVDAPLFPKEIDKLEFTGKLSLADLFPQYLHKAILLGANAKDSITILNHKASF